MSRARLATSIVIPFICATVAAFAHGSWMAVPLKDRIEAVDLVVLGTLGDIKPNYFHIVWFPGQHRDRGLGEYTSRYDEGKIDVVRVLRGNWPQGVVSLALDQSDQFEHPFRHMLRTFSSGQFGIWMVTRGMSGSFQVGRPDNFLPADSLAGVLAAIESLDEERGRRPRIIVRPSGTGPGNFTAWVEGMSGWTSATGQTAEEAVGTVLMRSWSTADLGIDVSVEPGQK